MNKAYRLISWALGISIVFCVLLFGWRVLLNQSQEETHNSYEYNIDRYRHVDPALIHYSELSPVSITASILHALTTDIDNNIFVSADLKLLKFNSNGELLQSIDLDNPCYCITTGPGGILYLGMGNYIAVADASLSIKENWGDLGENARLTSIALFGKHLYAADYGQRLVWKLSLDGKMAGQAGSDETLDDPHHYVVPSPYFDVAAGKNSFWIANPGRTKVEQLDLNEKTVTQWGKASMNIDGFSGCCNPSHIAITPDGLVVTAEKGLPRVKIFNAEGKLLSVVAGPENFEKTLPGCYSEALIKDLAVDSAGRVLVLDRSAGKVRIFIKNEI